jgi:hypothetical protein
MSATPEQKNDGGTPSRKCQRVDIHMSKRPSNNEEVDYSDPQLNKLTSILNDLAKVENGKKVSAIICLLYVLVYFNSLTHIKHQFRTIPV